MATKSASRMGSRSKSTTSLKQSKFPRGKYTIHNPDVCNQILMNKPIHLQRCTYDDKQITQAMEKEGFRKILIPSKEKVIYPKIITTKEFSNLLERTYVPTKEEKEASIAKAEYERERQISESMARKEEIRRMDLRKSREMQGRMTDIEQETRERTMHLLERARDMELEQEEQIKKCNKFILETKCRAIRDAQVEEKKLIKRESIAEERRVNELIEKERINAIRAEELQEKERWKRKQEFADFLKEQIQSNEQERILDYERKREESRLISLNNIVQLEAQMDKYKEKEKEQEKTRRELDECNQRLKQYKAMEEEENRIMDIRIQKFQQEKIERDKKIAEENHQEFLRREREKDRIAEQAIQSQGLQVQLDEMNAFRIQEEVEREWRRREKEKALLDAENLKNLRIARDQQINNKMQLQAMEIERDKQEFYKILKTQKEAVCREKKEREKKYQKALVHRTEILKQVNEKEREKIISRQKMYEEGLAIRAENELRKRRIKDAIDRKCKQLSENKLPAIYIEEVKRNMEKM